MRQKGSTPSIALTRAAKPSTSARAANDTTALATATIADSAVDADEPSAPPLPIEQDPIDAEQHGRPIRPMAVKRIDRRYVRRPNPRPWSPDRRPDHIPHPAPRGRAHRTCPPPAAVVVAGPVGVVPPSPTAPPCPRPNRPPRFRPPPGRPPPQLDCSRVPHRHRHERRVFRQRRQPVGALHLPRAESTAPAAPPPTPSRAGVDHRDVERPAVSVPVALAEVEAQLQARAARASPRSQQSPDPVPERHRGRGGEADTAMFAHSTRASPPSPARWDSSIQVENVVYVRTPPVRTIV